MNAQKKPKIARIIFISLTALFSLVIIAALIFGRQILYRTYPEYKAISQKTVIERTNTAASDNLYLKKLKNNALESYLGTADSSLAENLPDNEKELDAIINGSLPESDYDKAAKSLKTAMNASEQTMEDLANIYDNARMVNATNSVNTATSSLTADQLPAYLASLNQLASLTQEVAKEAALSGDPATQNNVQNAVNTLTTANGMLDNFSTFVNNSNNFNQFTAASYQASFSTDSPIMQGFLPVVAKVSDYLTQKAAIAQKTQEIQQLQAAVQKSQDLTNQSVPLDNFVGMTVAQVKAKMATASYNTQIADNNETGDDEVITSQEPAVSQYSRILKGKTVKLYTKAKVTEKPSSSSSKPTPSSSSSSSSPAQSSSEKG